MALQLIFNPLISDFQFVGTTGAQPATTILTTASTIDDSNVNFVFTELPTQLVINGSSYRQSKGWSWNAGTLTATIDNAVGVRGDIYGLL